MRGSSGSQVCVGFEPVSGAVVGAEVVGLAVGEAVTPPSGSGAGRHVGNGTDGDPAVGEVVGAGFFVSGALVVGVLVVGVSVWVDGALPGTGVWVAGVFAGVPVLSGAPVVAPEVPVVAVPAVPVAVPVPVRVPAVPVPVCVPVRAPVWVPGPPAALVPLGPVAAVVVAELGVLAEPEPEVVGRSGAPSTWRGGFTGTAPSR